MRLVDNWRHVLKRAWSIKLLLAAGALSGIEALLTILNSMAGVDTPWAVRVGLMAATPLVIMAAFVARLVAQQSIGKSEGNVQ